MTALSISITMFDFPYLLLFLKAATVWYKKFSNREASTPPSINCDDTTLSVVMAANSDTE